MFRGDQGTDARALLARITDCHVSNRRAKLALKFIGNRRVNEQSRACQANLPRVQVLPGGGLRGRVEVGVGTDYIRRLATELKADGSERARGGLADQLRRVGRAGEAQPVYVGMGSEG